MPITAALGGLRQKDCQQFTAHLNYTSTRSVTQVIIFLVRNVFLWLLIQQATRVAQQDNMVHMIKSV